MRNFMSITLALLLSFAIYGAISGPPIASPPPQSGCVDLANLKRVPAAREDKPAGLWQMTLKDVYALARRGESLALRDLEQFDGKAIGASFMIMRYEVEGGHVLTVHCDSPEAALNYARLAKGGGDPFDETLTVDIRAGTEAVAAYLNPLHSLLSVKIEDSHSGTPARELIYESSGYRYYLNTSRADRIFVTFDNGERLSLKEALEQRRLTVEDAVANGLRNIIMAPVDNPLGGFFTVLHHDHRFTFNREPFYPSASFMYVVPEEPYAAYFDLAELAEILDLQDRSELAGKLRCIARAKKLPVMADKTYLAADSLAEAGISVEIGWGFSSHTPVRFISSGE